MPFSSRIVLSLEIFNKTVQARAVRAPFLSQRSSVFIAVMFSHLISLIQFNVHSQRFHKKII